MFERPTTTTSRALEADLVVVEQLDHARRRARAQAGPVEHELADALGMEAVDVLGGIDASERASLVEAVRQRALHEDPVHGGIGVEAGRSARRARPAGSSQGARGGTSACRPRRSARSCAGRRSASRDRCRRAPWRDPAAARRRQPARARPRRRARGPTGRRPRRRGSVRSWRPRVDDRSGRQAHCRGPRRFIPEGDPQSGSSLDTAVYAGPRQGLAETRAGGALFSGCAARRRPERTVFRRASAGIPRTGG